MDDRQRIDALVGQLKEAAEAYYNDRDEVMSNYEYDALFDELTELEERTGYVREDSPTRSTGAEENIGEGQKEAHEYPALSLKKSKLVSDLQKWAGDRPIWLSWKLDGITLVATYDDGSLTRLLTRGNGQIGTNITYLAPYIKGLPGRVRVPGHLVVRGEAVISYEDFNRLNDLMEEDEEQYANPRNLVAGTLALDSKRAAEVEKRCVSFRAFTLVHLDETLPFWGARMQLLQEQGFAVVDREATTASDLPETIAAWTEKVRSGRMGLPVDGLVITFEDTDYAATGSVTGHHATNAGMAFKWQDTAAETILDHIEWSCAASTISPVAVFDMVQLEGTEVRRASLCNLSEMKRLGIGADRKTRLQIIKSNMIIPKCIRADAGGTTFTIPRICPVCGAPTSIRISEKTGTETLHCSNPRCTAKQIQKYTRFVSKNGMDIDGLSEKTLMKFINEGFITDFADLYDIAAHRERILALEGFGERSYENMIRSIEARRTIDPVRFLYALCIPMVGSDAAKKMIAACGTEGFLTRMKDGTGFEDIEGIGPERSGSVLSWYADPENQKLLEKLFARISVEQVGPVRREGGRAAGLTFVITGKVHIFANRDAFKAYVEAEGGTVAGSVSGKTDFLVNNDINSTSSKNAKARALNVPILSEEDFVERFGQP